MRTVTLLDQDPLRVWATMTDDGGLRIEGQDLGGYPGASEYEYALTISAADVPRVRSALDAGDGDDLLALLGAAGGAIVARGERTWLTGLGITPAFWSRIEPAEDLGEALHAPRQARKEPAPEAPGPQVETPIEADDTDFQPADRFTLSRAWWIAGQLVRRHPDLIVSRVLDPEQTPLLMVHDAAEITRIQFDLPAWIQYLTPAGLRRITWAEVFAEGDPLAILRTIETEIGLGVPIEARDSTQSLVYRTIACTLALGLDTPATWQAVHARVEVTDPDATHWELFDAFPTGRALAERVINAALDRAETEGAFVFHQPVWALLRDLEPVALLSVDGSAHISTGEVHLVRAFDDAARSISRVAVALFADHVP